MVAFAFAFAPLALALTLTPSLLVSGQSVQGGGSITSASDLPMSKVGKCIDAKVNLWTTANIATLASERSGYWVYSSVPNSPEFNSLLWAHVHFQRYSTPNNYLATIYTQVQNEELQIRMQLLLVDTAFGYTAASTVGNTNLFLTFKIFIYDHSPGRYAAIYICSNDVDDNGFDYRYVLAHGWPMTDRERAAVHNRDRANRFRGDLVML